MLATVLEVAPSPKLQNRFVSVPVEVSVNVTVNGQAPRVGVALKLATGATGLLLLMTPLIQAMCEETRVLKKPLGLSAPVLAINVQLVPISWNNPPRSTNAASNIVPSTALLNGPSTA